MDRDAIINKVLHIVAEEFNISIDVLTSNKFNEKVYVNDLRPLVAHLLQYAGIDKLTISFVLKCFLKTVDKLLQTDVEIKPKFIKEIDNLKQSYDC